jgi:hypothetical protein
VSSLHQQAALADNPQFQARVRALMVLAAGSIISAGADTLGPASAALRLNLAVQVFQNAAPLVERFSWAIVTGGPVPSGIAASGTAIASTTAGLPITVATETAHGLTTGDVVEIDGHDANPEANGTWVATVTGPETFTVPGYGSAFGEQTGTVTKQPSDSDMNTSIAGAWNDVAGITTPAS